MARSMAFSISRTFPGQAYSRRSAMACSVARRYSSRARGCISGGSAPPKGKVSLRSRRGEAAGEGHSAGRINPPEFALEDGPGKVPDRRGNDAHIDLDRFSLPSRLTSPSCKTLRILTWAARLISPISSRKRVPAWPSQSSPLLLFRVRKSPLFEAEKLASRRVSGIAPQFTATTAPGFGGC